MSRAHGKHTGRKPTISPGSAEGRQIGLGVRYVSPLKSENTHLANKPVEHEKPAVPNQHGEEFEGFLAHGVPPSEHGVYDRADLPGTQRGHYKPTYKKQPDRITPVPVVVVEDPREVQPIRTAVTKNFNCPVFGAEPVSICELDPHRVSVRVLNEGGGTNPKGARIGQLQDLAADLENNVLVGGAYLPAGMTSYLKLEAQNALYIVSMDANPQRISVIIETEVPGA